MRYIGFSTILMTTVLVLIVAFFYQKKESFTNFTGQPKTKIPKIIIQTWKSRIIPKKYQKHFNSVKNVNKNFKILFFSDKDIEKFFKEFYPHYYVTYKKLPIKIQKIDFFRYVAVYHYGGFYYDLDMLALKPLDHLVNNNVVFPIESTIAHKCHFPRNKYLCGHNCYTVLGNYAFGAVPKSNFLKLLVDNIHNNIDKIASQYYSNKQYYSNNNKYFNYYIYQTTGPDYISLLYHHYKDKQKIKILDNEINKNRHYFGTYALHTWSGSWKKD